MRDQAALKHRVKPSYCAAAAALRKALASVASGFETQMAGQRTEVSRVRQFQAKTARPVQLNQQLRGRFPTLVGACAGTGAGAHITGEVAWNGLRLVVAHDRAAALAQQQERRVRMDELENLAKDWAGKLDGQDQGARKRGRKLSDSGAKARIYHAVCEARWGKILKLDMKTELFSYAIDEQALRLAEMMDGKLLVLTNVLDMTPDQVTGPRSMPSSRTFALRKSSARAPRWCSMARPWSTCGAAGRAPTAARNGTSTRRCA